MSISSFGIKEVADVRFYPANALAYNKTSGKLEFTNKPNSSDKYTEGDKKLEFTTLKVSNLEITSETTDARGGKGNAKLLTWDHSREATLTLEDALLSIETIQALMGSDKGVTGKSVVITSDSFAGNYCIVGTTFAKDQENGKDHLFTFFVPNAKVGTDLTLTMEADGDPTVFSMTLNVLRASKTDSTMVALIAAEDEYTADPDGKTAFSQIIDGAN